MLLQCENPNCDTTFERCPSQVSPRNFCSHTCRNSVVVKGEGNGNWKGGTYVQAGYRFILTLDGYVQEHRVVMAKILGRPLLPEEHIHHVNHNRLDNRPENLQIKDQSTHMKEHAEEFRRTRWGWAGLKHGCIDCGTTVRPHYAKKLCSACYQRKRLHPHV